MTDPSDKVRDGEDCVNGPSDKVRDREDCVTGPSDIVCDGGDRAGETAARPVFKSDHEPFPTNISDVRSPR